MPYLRRELRRVALPFLFVAFGAHGCVTPEPPAFRHPSFTPLEIRKPALVLRLSLGQTGFPGVGGFPPREANSFPDAFEIAVLEGFNAEGILPVDVIISTRRSTSDLPFEGIDRRQALDRGHTLHADVVVILDASFSWRDLVFCRAERRPFITRATLWRLGVEVLRVADGTRLLIEPPGPALQLSDVEPDCERGRIERRIGAQELLALVVQRALTLLLRR